jgi:aminocarboxymuconate-semialdehyde decarboxylase
VILAHGGGYFPFQAGRLAHAAAVRPELDESPPDPWAYRSQIFVDTITHDVDALRFLVEKLGSGRILLGTDQPFDMATPAPCRTAEQAVSDAEDLGRILGGTARELFGFARDEGRTQTRSLR